MDSIYLDHNATTPIRPEVIEAVARCCARGLANPSSQHQPGQAARRTLEEAREATAALLGADLCPPRADRLIYTSGGTEANNLAILGTARGRSGGKVGRLVISAIEHPSVIAPAERLMEEGWRLDLLGVDQRGVVRTDRLADTISRETALGSCTLANHDTGTIQPVESLAEHCQAVGVPLHTDAAQAVGKIPVDFRRLGVALLSVAAHKFGGPLGIGALVIRHDVPIVPHLIGGPQESALRPGTEPVALAVGMRVALELAVRAMQAEAARITALRKRLEEALRARLGTIVVHGQSARRIPNTANIAFPGIDNQVLLVALDLGGVACSVGSACSSGSAEPSATLQAMGMPSSLVNASLRFSLGRTTTHEAIDTAVQRIVRVVSSLQPSSA